MARHVARPRASRRGDPRTRDAAGPEIPRGLLASLLVAFTLSGLAGLVYESIWSRYLGLLLGHGAYGQVLVLVLFLGGMAGGAIAASLWSERVRHPLRAYAAIEALVGVLGLVFHPAFLGLTDLAYERWFPALGSNGILALKVALAAVLLLPQSLLLGATFPLMSAGVVRRAPGRPGRLLALLYFTNSLGASAGGLVSGFLLVPSLGLPGALAFAAVLNLLVAGVVTIASRRAGKEPAPPAAAVAPPKGGPFPAVPPAEAVAPWLPHLLLAAAFGTAVASFFYEIAWIRMLTLVLGSATHSFELMLSAFILGLALGSLWMHRLADRLEDPLRALAIVQWAMGVLALATLPAYASSFHWMAGLVQSLQPRPDGYETFSLARYGICLVVMLPATFCAGMTLPLITRMLLRRGGESAIGAVYGMNTLGSIVGAAVAGLLLLPLLGVAGLLATGAALDMAIAAPLLAKAGPRSRRLALPAVAGGAALALGMVALVRLDPLLLVSGVYRTGTLIDPAVASVLHHRDGRTSTVSVRDEGGRRVLATNGKPDASLESMWFEPDPEPRPLDIDSSTQLLLALVSLAHAPEAKNVAVVGQGSGMTSHVLLGSPSIERLVTIEIEPEMIAGSRLFLPANRRVFEDPRNRFVIDDARSFLAATRERFDLIVSEPSNPWVTGVSGLFTDEFYARVRSRLGDHGVLGQWLNLYAIDDDLTIAVMAAIHRNFREYRTFLVSSADMLIVATNRPGQLTADWSVAERPAIAHDLRRTHPFTPRWFDALYLADRTTLAPLLAAARANSDFHPLLDTGAERALFERRRPRGWLQFHEGRLAPAALRAPVVDPPPDGPSPIPEVIRPRSLMWNARLRAFLAGTHGESLHPDTLLPELPEAMRRQRRLAASVASGKAPPDWQEWLVEALRGENDRHTGTSGWADEEWFTPLVRYAREQRAPVEVTRTLEWIRALDRRDYARAASLTDSLLPAVTQKRPWFGPGLLLDGGTMAKIAVGDLEGARRIVAAVSPHLQRAPDDLRTRLVAARLAAPP